MFGELPKLFDRDFAIGYFLPVACFLSTLYGLLLIFHLTALVPFITQTNPEAKLLIGTTVIGLSTWLISVFLLALNRTIYQLFEGYLWPRRGWIGCFWEWSKWLERQRYEGIWKESAENEKNKSVLSTMAK